MSKSIKILLLLAASLFSGNTTASHLTFSESRSPAVEYGAQIESATISTPDTSSRTPFGEKTEQITYLLETVLDSDLKDFHKDACVLSGKSTPGRTSVSKALFVSRILDLGFTLKKIIFPFHYFF